MLGSRKIKVLVIWTLHELILIHFLLSFWNTLKHTGLIQQITMHILIHLVQEFNSFVGGILVTDFAIILETDIILNVCNLGRVAPAEVHGIPLVDHIQH